VKKGKIIVFAAPSGAGKTTIVKYILNEFPEFQFSISATTRKRREKEIDGQDYFFIPESEFLKKLEQNQFVEWECFYDYYYGTLKSFITDYVEKGTTLIFDIDVKGAVSIKKNYPEATLIFVAPPSIDELKQRLIQRNTESDKDLKKRFERVDMEMKYEKNFDFVILNKDLETAKIKAKEIVSEILK